MKSSFWKDNDSWKNYALAGCICIVFMTVLSNLGGIFAAVGGFLKILRPVIIGAVIAYILDPMSGFFYSKVFRTVEKERLRRTLGAAMALLVLFGVIARGVSTLIPQVVEGVTLLADNLPRYIENLNSYIDGLTGPAKSLLEYLMEGESLLVKLSNILAKNLDAILAATKDVGGVAINVSVGLLFAVYFTLSRELLVDGIKRLLALILSPTVYTRTETMVHKFNSIFSKYIIFDLIDALIIGAANYLFLLIIHCPSALLLALVAALTNLVPTFGPVIGAGISCFILLLVAPAKILALLIFTLVIQLTDSYIIKPRLFGGALNVPGLIILIAIVILGKLMGIKGMLIAIPLAAFFVYLYSEVLIPWLERRRGKEEV